jgi:hypothetical protein
MAKKPSPKKSKSAPTSAKRKFSEDELDVIEAALKTAGLRAALVDRVMRRLSDPGVTSPNE